MAQSSRTKKKPPVTPRIRSEIIKSLPEQHGSVYSGIPKCTQTLITLLMAFVRSITSMSVHCSKRYLLANVGLAVSLDAPLN